MTKQIKADEQGYEIEEQTAEDKAELERIKKTGERLPRFACLQVAADC